MANADATVGASTNLEDSKLAKLPEDHGTMLTCTSLNQWLSQEANLHQGLLVTRPIDPAQWQPLADHLWTYPEEQDSSLRHEQIDLDVSAGEAAIQHSLQAGAHAVAHGLPPGLAEIVRNDAEALADVTRKLVPRARQIVMKLELFGTSACVRWHQDNYISRALVTYNCSGTAYTADSNVDFNELFYCGNNDCIIQEQTRCRSINVGDMIYIKGSKFPGEAQGLVHKAPDVRYHANGLVQSRIVFKVDVTKADEDEIETITTEAVAPEDVRLISRAELAARNAGESAWIAIDGMVYDVTNFKHPGGLHRIRLHAGANPTKKDADRAFQTLCNSDRAQKYMAQMLIGRLGDEV